MTKATPEYLLTAEEAWPAFEREILSAETRIVAGFRVFDPATQLRSEEARAIGDDWFDLLVHVLKKGVRIDLILSDFDPIVAPDLHQMTWASLRKMAAIREAAGPEARLVVIPALHPAETGRAVELVLWPKVRSELGDLCEWLNGMEAEERDAAYGDLPGTHDWLSIDEEGVASFRTPSAPNLHPVSHHQKLAVIDDRSLYIGGLDLNPRRYDTKLHHRAGEETWHDVQMIVRDPTVAAAAAEHIDRLIEVTRGDADPAPEVDGLCVTLSRHKPNTFSMAPIIVRRSIADRTLEQIAASDREIYFETQFFRDRELTDALVQRAREVPDLELLVVLPAAPEVVAFEKRTKMDARYGEFLQAECVNRIHEAFGERAFFASPAQKRTGVTDDLPIGDRALFCSAPLIYVHAKVSVFDRKSVLVSSANLNSRSLHWDTEAGYLHHDNDFAAEVMRRSVDHWLPDVGVDISQGLVAQVREAAELDCARQPENRRGFLLPYDVSAAESFGNNLPGIPEEMV